MLNPIKIVAVAVTTVTAIGGAAYKLKDKKVKSKKDDKFSTPNRKNKLNTHKDKREKREFLTIKKHRK